MKIMLGIFHLVITSFQDVEAVLGVAVLDGKLEQRQDRAFRSTTNGTRNSDRRRTPALTTVPCLYCPMSAECRTGHIISPESCEYFKQYFEL